MHWEHIYDLLAWVYRTFCTRESITLLLSTDTMVLFTGIWSRRKAESYLWRWTIWQTTVHFWRWRCPSLWVWIWGCSYYRSEYNLFHLLLQIRLFGISIQLPQYNSIPLNQPFFYNHLKHLSWFFDPHPTSYSLQLLKDRGLLPELSPQVQNVVCSLGQDLQGAASLVAARLREKGQTVDLVLENKPLKW